jgi:hypothetical protein
MGDKRRMPLQELYVTLVPGGPVPKGISAEIVYKTDRTYRHVGSPPKPGGTQELEQHSPGNEQFAPGGLHA